MTDYRGSAVRLRACYAPTKDTTTICVLSPGQSIQDICRCSGMAIAAELKTNQRPVMLPCRLLAHSVADGPANMALDEALLNLVAREQGSAYVRTYAWAKPTLSLGYFQSVADASLQPTLAHAPAVRRLTGGGALWHHHEVTYAVIIPRSHPLYRPNTLLYRTVHAAIAQLLTDHGAAASRHGDDPAHPARNTHRPFLCFTDRDPEDIIVQNCKVVGSAQRRRDGAVLQHGSVLLARSPAVPEIPGVYDVASTKMNSHDWPALIARQLTSQLGSPLELADVPDDVRSLADQLERTRYRNPAWTNLR